MSSNRLRSFIIAAGILAVGVVGMLILIGLKPDPPKDEPVVQTPIVEVVNVTASSGHLTISGNGTVTAARNVNLSAEVPGKIVHVSASYVVGGVFKQGDMLLQIDPSDYENAVAVAEAEVTRRSLEVELAEEESAIARDEWERLQRREGSVEDASRTELGSLVLREPQLKLAEAERKSAEARLNDAASRLQRTVIKAPFNGRMKTKLAEVGQYVAPGGVVASFYGTDHAEIDVALTAEQAYLIEDLFSAEARGQRASARVMARYGQERFTWEAYVHRINGSLDAATRTFQVIVRVDNPYRATTNRPPLLVGTYVDVEIEGRSVDTYFVVPRNALRENNQVWLVIDGRLEMRLVKVLQYVQDRIVVDKGLAEGDQVIVSALSVVADGMSVRVSE